MTERDLLRPEFIESVKLAVISTFSSICGTELKYAENYSNGVPFEGIVGIISLIGKEQSWSLMLEFPQKTASAIAQKFAGFEIDYHSDDMGDVVGELANVIAGDVIARLEAVGIHAEMSLPAVARGDNLEIIKSNHQDSKALYFNTPSGEFWLKLATGK